MDYTVYLLLFIIITRSYIMQPFLLYFQITRTDFLN
jgi:hypothetical protein